MDSANGETRRVVITGLGVISPLGNTKEALWEALIAGRSGVAPIPSAAVAFGGAAWEFSGKIGDFGPLEAEQTKAVRKGLKVMCRECQMGVAAAQRALADAGLKLGRFDPERTGVVYGSDYMLSDPAEFSAGIQHCLDADGKFDFSRWGRDGMVQLTPLWLLKYLPNMPASHLAIYNDLRGPSNSITHREAASNLAIGEAARIIARGGADLMIAGATGTRLHPMKAIHAAQQEQLAAADQEPAKACRPFELHRTGMVLGEGAGAIVLEESKAAEARGATIYGEVIGSASSSVLGSDLVAQPVEALVNAMRSCLRDGGVMPDQIGHLHAHGLGTREGDFAEARAIREVFGQRAESLPVTAAKSYFGNLGAGSGAVEFAASTLALIERTVFPILNYDTPDPACSIAGVRCVTRAAGDSFMNVNVTPQGQASAVLVRTYG
ncbi:MAG: beta-ketoacyl-[acyl-carrier-protein] synthase family protein [Pirellulales bacterium]